MSWDLDKKISNMEQINDNGGIVHELRKRTRLERIYWMGVILTEDWNEDNSVLNLAERILTREILISKPVYQPKYGKEVRYVAMSFFKTVTTGYFGKKFVFKNDIVPVINSTAWIRGKQYVFCKLIKTLGKPDFEYYASECKTAYNSKRRKRT